MHEFDLGAVKTCLIVQKNLIENLKNRLDHVEKKLNIVTDQSEDIERLNKMLEEVESNIDIFCKNKGLLNNIDLNDLSEIQNLYKDIEENIKKEYQKIEYQNWYQFCVETYNYCKKQQIDPFLPWEALLTKEDLKSLIEEEKEYYKQYKWDKWDYIFVGFAGIVGGLVDIFLVRIPKTINYTPPGSKEKIEQIGSPITSFLRELSFPDWLQKWLEDVAKVPYDLPQRGVHRIFSLSHDPVCFIIGILDILQGCSTFVVDGKIVRQKVDDPPSISVLEAFIKHFLHLISDAFTKQGLPAPFMSLFTILEKGSFPRPNIKSKEPATIADLVVWMYFHGYDLRHYMTTNFSVAAVELILRGYLLFRKYKPIKNRNKIQLSSLQNSSIWNKLKVANNPKYRLMLLVAHAIACAFNAGKIILYQGNPLAINYFEWGALVRYLLPSLKYWFFDKQKLKIKYMEHIIDQEWENILVTSQMLLQKSFQNNLRQIDLGKYS